MPADRAGNRTRSRRWPGAPFWGRRACRTLPCAPLLEFVLHAVHEALDGGVAQGAVGHIVIAPNGFSTSTAAAGVVVAALNCEATG